MLGYPTAFMAYMFGVNRRVPARNAAAAAYRWLVLTFLLIYIFAVPATRTAARSRRICHLKPAAWLIFRLVVRKAGAAICTLPTMMWIFATGIRDCGRITWNTTRRPPKRLRVGHVQFDFENQHVEADEAHYNVKTEHGTFHNVRGTVKIERRPNPNVLLSRQSTLLRSSGCRALCERCLCN